MHNNDEMPAATLDNRYSITDTFGHGGMGVVCRAVDRLIGNAVALKQVTGSGPQLQLPSLHAYDDVRLAFAHGFQTLASLSHLIERHTVRLRSHQRGLMRDATRRVLLLALASSRWGGTC